jgi:hypothetical protein
VAADGKGVLDTCRSRSGCLLLVYRAGKRVLWLTLPVLFCCRCFAPPQADYISILNGEPAPLWHVIYDDEEELGEEDLEDYEVAAVLIRGPCYYPCRVTPVSGFTPVSGVTPVFPFVRCRRPSRHTRNGLSLMRREFPLHGRQSTPPAV